jgi:hypothetical protein
VKVEALRLILFLNTVEQQKSSSEREMDTSGGALTSFDMWAFPCGYKNVVIISPALSPIMITTVVQVT